MKARIWAVSLCSFLVLTPASAAPPVVSYQGLLTDSQGTPLNGTASLEFRIYAALSGGSPLWTEPHPSVSVVDGVYSVELGSLSPLPAELFSGAERYLEVTANSELMTPRQRMTSVPYALTAGRVEQPAMPSISTLAGLPCNAANPLAGSLVISYAPNGAVSLSCSGMYTLTVALVGSAGQPSNSVSSSPTGISCSGVGGSDCSEAYVGGTVVTLTATSSLVYTFVGWSGACSGTGPCVVTMDSARSVTATWSLL
jgi:uncharacterized repeat protein (TIGR02543 family)